MRSVVFCHAAQDAGLARELGSYLAANLAVECCYDEGLIHARSDLLDIVGRALSAQLVVLLLSPEAVPSRWVNDTWQPVLLEQPREFGSQLILALARDCKFPALLRRQPFCDFTGDRLSGLRRLKRLIFRRSEAEDDHPATETIEELRCLLADRPGVLVGVAREKALAFEKTCGRDFEGAFWVDCARRSACGILGEMAGRLGLRLSGSFEQNQQALRNFCRQRRCLFVLDHVDAQQAVAMAPGALASVLVTAPTPAPEPMPLPKLLPLFAAWAREERSCLSALGDAYHYLQQEPWPTVQHLGPEVLAVLKNQDRLAEANEVLEILLTHARAQGDENAIHRFEWERSWILGHWGEPYLADAAILQPPGAAIQLGFGFA
jgi:hypothetical protein